MAPFTSPSNSKATAPQWHEPAWALGVASVMGLPFARNIARTFCDARLGVKPLNRSARHSGATRRACRTTRAAQLDVRFGALRRGEGRHGTRLYYAPGTCALACWIALEWTGADHQVERVSYASPEFRRINPLAQAPALDVGGPRVMTQAGAILSYLADVHRDAKLGADDAPDSRFALAKTMSFLTGDLHPALWSFCSPQRYTTEHAPEALAKAKDASHARGDRVMTHLDGLIGDGEHVFARRRSVADPYAFVMAR